jgi:hypothetical protein
MKRIMMVMAVCGVLAVPSLAFANGGSSCQSYNSQTSGVTSNNCKHYTAAAHVTTTTTPQNQVVEADQSGTLPFTGLDIGALLGGAVVLMGLGLVVRRITSHVDQS